MRMMRTVLAKAVATGTALLLIEVPALLWQVHRLTGCDVLQIEDAIGDPALRPNDQGGRGARGKDLAAILVDRDLHVVDLIVIECDRFP